MSTGFNSLPRLGGNETRVIKYEPVIDGYRRYLSDNPTPSRFASILKDVDNGDVAAIVELNEEMEAKDAHLQAVARTRRNALISLEWQIEPDDTAPDQVKAEQVAKVIEDDLNAAYGVEDCLKHNASAIGPNVAVTEIIWRNAILSGFCPVPGHRLISHPENSTAIFVEANVGDWWGIPAFPGKFIVHHPETRGGFPLRATITHAASVLYLIKHLTRTDWLAFSELYGNPWRVASYDDTVVDDDRATVQTMLENLSTDLAATLPKGVSIEFLQASGKGETYKDQMDWAESKMSILYLGQTLTTDIGDVGSRAAATVHDNVRIDLLVGDISAEAATIREQLLAPMCRLRFPNDPKVPVPMFTRVMPSRRNLDEERTNMEKVRVMREMGLPLLVDDVYNMFGFTRPDGFIQEVIGGPSVTPGLTDRIA